MSVPQWLILVDGDGIYCEDLAQAFAEAAIRPDCIGEIRRVTADGGTCEGVILRVLFKDGRLWSIFDITRGMEGP